MHMTVRVATDVLVASCMWMSMTPVIHINRDDVQRTVTHASFRHQRIRKLSYFGHGSMQDDALEAILVVEMGMHCGYRQVVMVMLQMRQAFREFALVVIIDIAQVGDAVTGCRMRASGGLQLSAQHVAHRFGAVAVAASGNQLIEILRQIFIQ